VKKVARGTTLFGDSVLNKKMAFSGAKNFGNWPFSLFTCCYGL